MTLLSYSVIPRRRWTHIKVVFGLVAIISLLWLQPFLFGWHWRVQQLKQWDKRYSIVDIFVTICRILTCLGLPSTILNVAGIVWFNSAKKTVRCSYSPISAPYICFRVVTRGLFPDLVRQNVEKNIEICSRVNLTNFIFEVVTDSPINLQKVKHTRELVVPYKYRPLHGSKFKARALHFCNEVAINRLDPDDWIVHLDEETLITEDSVVGILNFICSGEADFGQGVITYASGPVVNWITTLIDSERVGVDYGSLRFTLSVLRRPLLNWKGSFVVARAAAEHDVSFDHGLEGSIAEDCYFGVLASQKGYKFGFIDGDMLEQSPFTLTDFIKQRTRWNQGLYLVCMSKALSFRHKIGIWGFTISNLSQPLCTASAIFTFVYGIPMCWLTGMLFDLMLGVSIFLSVFGTYKSMERREYSLSKKYLLMFSSVFLIPIYTILLNIASISTIVSLNSVQFHIVEKDISERAKLEHFSKKSKNRGDD